MKALAHCWLARSKGISILLLSLVVFGVFGLDGVRRYLASLFERVNGLDGFVGGGVESHCKCWMVYLSERVVLTLKTRIRKLTVMFSYESFNRQHLRPYMSPTKAFSLTCTTRILLGYAIYPTQNINYQRLYVKWTRPPEGGGCVVRGRGAQQSPNEGRRASSKHADG